jgi:hypothetical protein
VEVPGGRYKIIERGRRLITIDTLTGLDVGTSGNILPPPTSDKAMELPIVGEAVVAMMAQAPSAAPERQPLERQSVIPGPWARITQETQQQGRTSPQGRVLPKSKSIDFSRFTLRTSASYDANGPRDVTLSLFAILWWVLTHHWRVALFLIVGAFLFAWLLLLTPLLFIPAVRHAVLSLFRPSLTRLFDAA